MNPNGRIVGGVLIGVAVLWLLRSVGALPFLDRANNQVATNQASAQTPPDRPPIADFNATRTGIGYLNPGTGTGTENFGTPGTSTGSTDPSAIAQTSGTTTGTSGTSTAQQSNTPAVRAGW